MDGYKMKNINETWMKQRSFRRLVRTNMKNANGGNITPINNETVSTARSNRFARMGRPINITEANNKFNIVDKIDYDGQLKCKNKIHVLIVDFQQLRYTQQIINDLLRQDTPFDLTIFEQVANKITKDYLDKLKSEWYLDNCEVNIIYNSVNAPLNHIWNWFYENTTNPYLAILNNDIRICDNFISDAEKIFGLEDDCGIIIHPTNRPEYKKQNKLNYEKVKGIPTMQGWDFVIKREAYSLIPDCFMIWRGDVYLFSKIYENKWSEIYDISSPMIHYVSVTTKAIKNNIADILKSDGDNWRRLGYKEMVKRKDNKYTQRKFTKEYQLDNSTPKYKKICYTSITGKYDTLKDPTIKTEGWQYICFTDNKSVKSNIWEILPIPSGLNKLSDVKKQRLIKICPHKYLPQYDECLWVDGNITIQCDLNNFVRNNCNGDFCISKHSQRNCIYDECTAVEKLKKDTHEHVEEIRTKLRRDGYPINFGLAETGVIYRKNNDIVNLINNEWGRQMINNQTHRDQLTFNYVLWELQQEVYYLSSDTLHSGKLFRITRHNNK